MFHPRWSLKSPVLLFAAAMALVTSGGCQPPGVSGTGPESSGTSSTRAGGSGGAGAPSPSGPSLALPDGGGADLPAAPAGNGPIGEKCAESGAQAEQVPVDLLFLVDSSGSMAAKSGNSTKWTLATEALRSFVKDPKSAGLGIGVTFFPRLAPEKLCTTNAQCGGAFPAGFDTCIQKHRCATPGQPVPLSGPECDGPLDPCEDPAHTCLPLGTCSQSGALCLGVGTPCPGGAAGDMCMARSRACQINSSAWCPQTYDQATVAIAALPANEPALLTALTTQYPYGGTPLGPAVHGGIMQLKARQAATPGRRVALVLVSDGLPDGFCGGNFAPAIVSEVTAARMATPSIPSYVIGVFAPEDIPRAQPVLEQLATAGGSGQPFILMTSSDLGMRFQDALNQIRGTALACEFTIPTGNAAIDYGKVNVRWQGAAATEDLLYVGTAARCDPIKGGWYFDVDPASGGTPKRVLICDASCTKFKTDASAKVELRFGCKTRVID
jgi:Mg-chelatase subunit ChlD